MKRVLIMRGLPGSGKTTFAKNCGGTFMNTCSADSFFEWPDGRYVFDKDKLTKAHDACWQKFIGLVEKSEDLIIVDNTNIQLKEFSKYIKKAESNGYAVVVFRMVANVDQCIARGLHKVPEEKVRARLAQFETYPSEILVPDICQPLENAVIIDLDGTIALNTTDRPFYGKDINVYLDEPNTIVCDVIKAYLASSGATPVFVTGREAALADDTRRWIKDKFFDKGKEPQKISLFTRDTGDYRSDAVVKREIYYHRINWSFKVLCVFDDRNSVVKMWRSLGLTCFQVANGDF